MMIPTLDVKRSLTVPAVLALAAPGDAPVIDWPHQERDRCFTSPMVIAQLACWCGQGGNDRWGEVNVPRALSQVKLAEVLQIQQPEISKIEHQTDMYISTLRDYIRAMAGDLEIMAKFPDGEGRQL